MWTARRWQSIVALLAIGALFNFLLAQAIGWWSGNRRFVRTLYPTIGDDAPEVTVEWSFGRRIIKWRSVERPERSGNENPGLGVRRRDDPSSVPRWSRVWDPAARQAELASSRKMAFTDNRHTSDPMDIAIGWPVLSYVLHTDPRIVGDTAIPDPPLVVWGGYVPAYPMTNPETRVLAWYPLFPQALIGSLLWAAVPAAPFVVFTVLRTRRRRRANRCLNCGYDRSGLASDDPCPECGVHN